MPIEDTTTSPVVVPADLLMALATKDCTRISRTDVPNIDESELVRTFPNVPRGKEDEALAMLDQITDPKNGSNARRYVVDPEADRIVHKGVYHLVANKIDRNERGFPGVIQTLRKGWMETIDWAAARLAQSNAARSNTKAAGTVEGTTSDSTEHFLVVQFPYVNPEKTRPLVAQLLGVASYTNPTVGTASYTGTFHTISVGTKKEQDGTDTIMLTLAMPQFTLAAYRDVGGYSEADVYYLWGVPKDQAQTVLDAWKVAYPNGSSASASYRDGANLVDLTLTKMAALGATASFDWVNNNCSTKTRFHYGTGLTEAQVTTFLALHDAMPFEGTTPTYGSSGMSRRVNQQVRGDSGLYDVVIEEILVEYDANKHLFDVSVFDGGNAVSEIENGWNVPLSVLATIKAGFDTTVQADNARTTFEVTRKDDCTFDYKASNTVFTADNKTISATGTGIAISHIVYKDHTATLAPTSNRRERVEISAQLNDHGSVDATIVTKTVKESTDTADTGTAGVRNRIYAGANADPGDVAALITAQSLASAIRKDVRIDLSPKDDDTTDYKVSVTEVREATDSATTGANGIKETVFSGTNTDPGDLSALITAQSLESAKRKRVVLDLSPKDDGSVDYRAKVTEVQETTDSASTVSASYGETLFSGKNADPGDLTSLITAQSLAAGARKRVTISINPNDDGTVDYEARALIVKEVEGTLPVANYHRGRKQYHGANADTIPTLVPTDVILAASVNGNDDGTFDYSILCEDGTAREEEVTDGRTILRAYTNQDAITLGATEKIRGGTVRVGADGKIDASLNIRDTTDAGVDATGIKSGELLAIVTEEVHREDSPDDKPVADPTAGQTIKVNFDLDPETGLANWRKEVEVESEQDTGAITIGTNKDSATFQAKSGAAAMPTTTTPAVGHTVQINGRRKRNGLYEWTKVDITETEKTVMATAKTQIGNLQIAVVVVFVDGAATAPATTANYTAGVLEEFSDVRQKPNGLFSYVKTTTTYTIVDTEIRIKAAGFREKYRDMVFSKYFVSRGSWYGVLRDYHRDVQSLVTRTYSLTPPDAGAAPTATDDTLTEVNEIARGLWAKDVTVVTYGAWTEDGMEVILNSIWT